MIQKKDLKGYNAAVDHPFEFNHFLSDIQQSTRQQAADQN